MLLADFFFWFFLGYYAMGRNFFFFFALFKGLKMAAIYLFRSCAADGPLIFMALTRVSCRDSVHPAVVQSQRILPLQVDKQEVEGGLPRDLHDHRREPLGSRHVQERRLLRPGACLSARRPEIALGSQPRRAVIVIIVGMPLTFGDGDEGCSCGVWSGGGAGLSVPERRDPPAVGERVPDHVERRHPGPGGVHTQHPEEEADG